MASSRCFPYRPQDYMYDPIFTVSGPTDHYKAAVIAQMSSYKFQVCPIFENMFSDLRTKPRTQLVRRPLPPIQPYTSPENEQKDSALIKSVNVSGADRVKFFCHIINLPSETILPLQPRFTIERYTNREDDGKSHKDVAIETKYRESSAQTSPSQPPHFYLQEKLPELLQIDFLKWGKGLPAGVFEVQLIERARMKRKWDKYLDEMFQRDADIEKLKDCIEAIERDEWAFREQAIQDIQNLRYELLVEMFEEIIDKSKLRVEEKLNNLMEIKKREIDEKKMKLRKKTNRELRKLEQKRVNTGKKMDIVEEYISSKSELYAPLLRQGERAKHWHFVLDERMKKHKTQFHGVEHINTLPAWVSKPLKISCPQTVLCVRQTKWTAPVLKELHEELKNINKVIKKQPCTLLKKIEKHVEKKVVMKVHGVSNNMETLYQSLITLQSAIRGRTSQMIVYEGRSRCKELINEFKQSHGLLKQQKLEVFHSMQKVKKEQRNERERVYKTEQLTSYLDELQGSMVGSLLDFLNKELFRLLEERRIHAICKHHERERHILEASEAGRRQKEIRRRKEHDEMFKQLVKINQESVDLYLRNIITEGIDFVSEQEAEKYVKQLGQKLDKEIDENYDLIKNNQNEQESLVNDLIHHFLLPEIAKEESRKRILAEQKIKLKTIHDTIFSHLEELQSKQVKTSTLNNTSHDADLETLQANSPEEIDERPDEDSSTSIHEYVVNEIVEKLYNFLEKSD